jgi:pimeloyl-ACP methyl ester carboxylesterase
VNLPANLALLEKIGPAIVLTHSQSGVFGWKLADLRPDLVAAHVAIEPNGPPFHDVQLLGGKEWYVS